MPEIYDFFEQEKRVDKEQLISICRKCLENKKWIIIDITLQEKNQENPHVSCQTHCNIQFEGGTYSKRWTNKGTVTISHNDEGYKIILSATCSMFARGDFFQNNMYELFKELKLSSFTIKEIKKDTKESSLKGKLSVADEIQKLGELFDKGIITKSEFASAKKKLLE